MRTKNETSLEVKSDSFMRKTDYPDWNFRTPQQAWSPPADVYETKTEIVVKVEIAGMETSDFSIDYSDSVLTIQGTRSEAIEKKAFHRMEIRYGIFKLRFEIYIPISISQITAEYKNGFLTIQLPKAETTKVQINPD